MLVIDGLSADESRVAIACVRAIAEGPWFPPGDNGEDQELQTLVGFTRDELREIHKRLLDEIMPDKNAMRAIGQCVLTVVHGFGMSADVPRWVAASVQVVEALCDKWFREIDP